MKQQQGNQRRSSQASSDERDHFIEALRKVVQRNVVLGIILLAVSGVGLEFFAFSPFFPAASSVFGTGAKELGIGLIITAITTLLLRISVQSSTNKVEQEIFAFVKGDVAEKLDEIGNTVNTQTQKLVGISASLLAIDATGISRIYLKRDEASEQIKRDIQDLAVSELDIIGISLNDFLRDDNKEFHALWQVIKGYIAEPATRPGKLTIRVLMIDPTCNGAYLRSTGESLGAGALPERLATDVHLAATYLDALARENESKRAEIARNQPEGLKDEGVHFEFRLYQLPPSLFLIRTNTVSYVQPYYFWATRDVDASMPLLRCDDGPHYRQHPAHLHRGMKDHFNLIWNYAAVSFSTLSTEYQIGIDKGIHQCGIVNVFDASEAAFKRMQWLLQNAKRHVDIQGISLHSFFDGGLLQKELQTLAERGDVEIRVLFLDPNSQQASYRSFREYLLKQNVPPEMTFDQFQKLPDRFYDKLHTETQESMDQALSIANLHSAFQMKLYDSATSCFLFRVDDTVLIEQFHYGKLGRDFSVASPILGKDMAVIEYIREPKNVYKKDSVRNSFHLMVDHFNFVFTKCSKPVNLTTSSILSPLPYSLPTSPPSPPPAPAHLLAPPSLC